MGEACEDKLGRRRGEDTPLLERAPVLVVCSCVARLLLSPAVLW